MNLIKEHQMHEAQVMLQVSGTPAKPHCVMSARAGYARLLPRGHSAFSLQPPADLLDTAVHLRDDALAKLARFSELPAALSMQGMIRERRLSGGPRRAFAAFWGSLKLADYWDAVFGTNPDGDVVFRRGPWEQWPRSLPSFEDLDPSVPLILSPYCATLFHEAVGHALEEDYLQGSPLKFYRGERISHPALTVLDRPDLRGYAGSMSVDDVGRPVSATMLIQQGILVGDLSMGRGAFRRASFRDVPLVRATNFVIRPGAEDAAAWMRDLERCYYVAWIQSGNWQPGSERIKVMTGPVFELRRGEAVAQRPWVGMRLTIGRFLSAVKGVGADMVMDPVVHWCVKKHQRVPMSMGAPSLLLRGWS